MSSHFQLEGTRRKRLSDWRQIQACLPEAPQALSVFQEENVPDYDDEPKGVPQSVGTLPGGNSQALSVAFWVEIMIAG